MAGIRMWGSVCGSGAPQCTLGPNCVWDENVFGNIHLVYWLKLWAPLLWPPTLACFSDRFNNLAAPSHICTVHYAAHGLFFRVKIDRSFSVFRFCETGRSVVFKSRHPVGHGQFVTLPHLTHERTTGREPRVGRFEQIGFFVCSVLHRNSRGRVVDPSRRPKLPIPSGHPQFLHWKKRKSLWLV